MHTFSRIFSVAFLSIGALAGVPAMAQEASPTPHLCNALAIDVGSRYVVQLVAGGLATGERGSDPLVGRIAPVVELYRNLDCPVPALASLMECLQVAADETGGDMRTMVSRRQTCEAAFQNALLGR